MANEIVVREITPSVWGMIEKIAPTMKESRFFGVATVPQAQAVMLKGFELGLPLAASFDFITVIADKPALIPRGALALIYQSNLCEEMDIKSLKNEKGEPDRCEVTMKRRGGIKYTASFSMDDAKRADLIKPNSGWAKYPDRMMLWRALGFAADVVFPDVIGGLKHADELGADLTPEGNVVDATWTPVAVKPMSTAQVVPDATTLLSNLTQAYGPERLIKENGGTIPTTIEELTKLKAKLDAGLEFTLQDVGELAH